MLAFLKRLWHEAFGENKDWARQSPADSMSTGLECSENDPKKEAVPEKNIEPEITTETACRMMLDEVSTIEELDRQYRKCPLQFNHLFEPYLKKFLLEINEISIIEDIYFNELDRLIMDRYRELFPSFLANAKLIDLEERYEYCRDQEQFGQPIKTRYQELLYMVDTIDELEEYFDTCPDEFETLYLGPYEKLLERVCSLNHLVALFPYASDQFNHLFPWHYRRLLEEEIFSLAELEDRFNACPECFDGLIFSRYQDILQTVTSIEELAERISECDYVFEGLILARSYDLLKSIMEKMSDQQKNELCENIYDGLKPLAMAFRDRNPPTE